MLLPHGTGLMPRMFDPHPLRKCMANFDRILLAGPYDLEAVRDHPTANTILPRVVSAGFPFLDRLKKPRLTRDEYCSRVGIDPAKRIVLFAPHWTGLLATGAVPYVEGVVSALKTLEANLIVKLHTCSFYPAMARGVKWLAILQELCRDRRVHVDDDADDLLALAYADVLVTDFSSRAFVFMALHKPVVLHSPAGSDPVEENGERMDLMRSASYLARSPARVAKLVRRLLQDPQPHPAACSVSERCFANLCRASKPVADLIRREITG